ncbi:MAG TPA: CcmD family protein [Candidatus Kryptonia bacterium]
MDSLFNFLDSHSLYVVLIIVLVIWLGIFIYLFRLDKKVTRLYEKAEGEKEKVK